MDDPTSVTTKDSITAATRRNDGSHVNAHVVAASWKVRKKREDSVGKGLSRMGGGTSEVKNTVNQH